MNQELYIFGVSKDSRTLKIYKGISLITIQAPCVTGTTTEL